MDSLLDFAGLDATGTDLHPPDLPVGKFDSHSLDVGIPPATGSFVRMAYLVTGARLATTDLTNFRHGPPPYEVLRPL